MLLPINNKFQTKATIPATYATFVLYLGEKYNLSDIPEVDHYDLTGLKTEVALVLIGLSDPQTLHRYIDLEIGGTGWEELENEIHENIFSPIGEILEIIEKHNAY